MNHRRVILGTTILVLAISVLVFGQPVPQSGAKGPSAQAAVTAEGTNWNPYTIADVAEAVTPAVVYIEAEWPKEERSQRDPFDDPFFRRFFGDWPFSPGPESPQQRTSRGTGFIIDEDGHILTNQHVVGHVDQGQKITVRITTDEYTGEVEATLLGSDYQLDLAVLKIDKPKDLKKLPTVPLGDSDGARPGEWVIAVGNPYGKQFEHTVTVGFLSAKGREIRIFDDERRADRVYTELMQTDAAINPGNSGGPLINVKGEVIGINTAVSVTAQGIGFAVPIAKAIEVMDQLIHGGKVLRPWLGISYGDLSEDDAEYLGLKEVRGIVISQVMRDTPAQAAGLLPFDVIVGADQQPITKIADFQALITNKKPGDKLVLEVIRRGQWILIPVTLGERPADI